MNDTSRVNQSSRFETVGELMIHGYQGVLLLEVFSGEWTVAVNVQHSLGDDGVPVTVRGKDRDEVVRRAAGSVQRLVEWLGVRAA